MRALIRKTLRLAPVVVFVFAANAASAQTPQQLEEVRQYKAKMDANLDNPNFDETAAQAHLDALMAAYGIAEIPTEAAAQSPVSALRSPGAGEASSTLSEPSNESLIKAMKEEIELYKDDPAMAEYVKRLRADLDALERKN